MYSDLQFHCYDGKSEKNFTNQIEVHVYVVPRTQPPQRHPHGAAWDAVSEPIVEYIDPKFY